jgi:hypothetical protein
MLDAGAVTGLVGEVHLHQLQGGSHAWTSFLSEGLPISTSRKDSITEIDTAITATDGPCILYVTPDCAPSCVGKSFCYAPNACQPLPAYDYIDAGEVDATGSSVMPLIRMFWSPAAGAYDSVPAPGAPELFAGGDPLHLTGGTAAYAFTLDVTAPLPVGLTAPDPTTDFRMPDGALAVAWAAGDGDSVEILMTAAATSGASAEVRCLVPDTGSFTVPASLVGQMPRPPRVTTFEVVRNDERIVPLAGPGTGVFVHVSQTTYLSGMD